MMPHSLCHMSAPGQSASAIEVLLPERDRERWEALVAGAGTPDAYYRPGYALAYEVAGHGKAIALLLTLAHSTVLLPLLVRTFVPPGQSGEVKDAYSPYGYAGLVVAQGQRPLTSADARRCLALVRDWAAGEGITCCVLRLHPLAEQASWFREVAQGDLLLRDRGATFALDLAHWNESAGVPAGMRKGRRSDLTVARKRLRVTWAPPDDMERAIRIFTEIYGSTMGRLDAEEFYLFPPEYYRALARGLGNDFGIAIAWQDEVPVGAAVFFAGPKFAHYHLSGTTEAGREARAATLLVQAGAEWGRAKGCTRLHLGGGMSREQDSLLAFKKSFGGKQFQYSTLTVIADPAQYRRLYHSSTRVWPYIDDPSPVRSNQEATPHPPVPVFGIGAGGHARVVLEILELSGGYEVRGLLDTDRDLIGHTVHHIPVVANDSMIETLAADGVRHFFVGVGSVGDCGPRKRLYERAVAAGLQPVDAIHPRAVISPTARIGRGATIMAEAVVNSYAILSENVIVNTAAVVEHDCVIHRHVHIASRAVLASGVRVGEAAHIGAGAVIRQGITIGEGAVVGAGAVVVKDVPPRVTVVGVPARELRVPAHK